MKTTTLAELLEEELKDIYSAETQIIAALPKLAQAAESKDLRAAFEKHLEQSRTHLQRIEEICNDLKIQPRGKRCAGMEGLIREGEEVIDSDMESEPRQAALIGAAQRVEPLHFGDVLGERRERRRQVPDQPVDPRPHRRVGIVHDQREALHARWRVGPGEGRRDVGAVAGMLRRNRRTVAKRRAGELQANASRTMRLCSAGCAAGDPSAGLDISGRDTSRTVTPPGTN